MSSRERKEKSGPAVGDLIEVPPIRTVIQLLDARSENRSVTREIAETFVITDEIEEYLRQFLEALALPCGAGAFLKGHYGSGKSHFLSFLTMLIEGGAQQIALAGTLQKARESISGKRFFTVLIPLFLFNARESLDEIVLVTCQKALSSALQRTVNLSHSTMLLDSFNTYILPKEKTFLEGLSLSEKAWQSLCSDSPGKAAEKALTFLQTLPSNPLSLHFDRREVFGTIRNLLREKGYAGLILIIDELSEFLRAKPSAREFNEDIRSLQFLGEWSAHEPLWTICSLQEHIEDVGYIEQDIYKRIKDRYRFRFTLSTKHIESLIEKRVLIKREGSRPIIDDVYIKLLSSFPDLTITKDNFFRIYPLHPSTLTMLEHLMSLFSQHRGIVDFLRTAVGGDPERALSSILAEQCDRLLTCDAIFDHFQEKIKETVEIAPYYHVAYRSLQEDILRIFQKELDRKIAFKMVKIMILTELSPLEKRKTAEELADLVVERVSSLDASVNYDYAREVILDRLVRESGYVGKAVIAEDGRFHYFIDLTANVTTLVQKRTREILRTVDMDSAVWRKLLTMMNAVYLPFKEHLEGKTGPCRIYTKWDYTAREGWLRLCDITDIMPGEIEHLEGTLRKSEEDFILLMGFPVNTESQWRHSKDLFTYVKSSPYAGAIIGWVPAQPDDRELEALAVTYAHTILRSAMTDDSEDREVAACLDEFLEKEKAYLREIITRLYFEGRFVTAAGELPSLPGALELLPFPRLIARLIAPALEAIYPRHREIRPFSDGYNQATLEKAANLLCQGSRLSVREAEDKGVLAAVESALVPMGLVKRTQSSFQITADPSKTPFLGEILEYLITGRPVPLDDIYMKMRKSPFGVIRPLFNTAVAFLIYTGLLTPYNGLIITASPSLRKLFTFEINAVGEGKLIEKGLQENLGTASFIWGHDVETSPFTMALQRSLWERAVAGIKALSEKVRRLRDALARIKSYSVASLLPLDELESCAAGVESFLAVIPLNSDSKKGLEGILEEIAERPALPEACTKIDKHLAFLSGDFEFFQRLHSYLSSPMLVIPTEAPYGHLAGKKAWCLRNLSKAGEAVTHGEAGELFSEIQNFINEYKKHYAEAHDDYYGHPHFREWQALRDSREFAVLRRLSRLYGLEVTNDIIRIQQLIDGLPKACSKTVQEEIALTVRCSCGYRLGEPLQAAAPQSIKALISGGIEEYCISLTEAPMKEKIELYAAGLRDAGRREQAVLLGKFLAPASVLMKEALSLFSEDAVEMIYRALFTRINVVERNIDRLCDDLKGRRFTPARLRQHLDEWLDVNGLTHGSGEETYIHIVSPKSDDLFSLWEGYEKAREVIREEGRRFLPAFYSAYFLHRQGRAVDSAFLATRFRMDRGRLETIESLGQEALETEKRYEDVLRAEKVLFEEGESEEFQRETGVDACSIEDLLHFLSRDRAFPFIARRAAERLLAFYDSIDDCSSLDSALSSLEKSCSPQQECGVEASFLTAFLRLRGNILESQAVKHTDPLSEYSAVIAPMAYNLELLRTCQFKCELFPGSSFRALERSVRQIQKDYREKFRVWASLEMTPSVKDFNREVFAPLRVPFRGIPAFILIIDAMRLDLWQFLEPLFSEILPSHLKKEQCLVAAVPTDTATNRPYLIGVSEDVGEGVLGGEAFTLVKASELAVKRGTIDELIRSDVPLKVLHFNFVDDRIHHSSTPLPELYEGLRSEFIGTVAPHLSRIPEKSLICIVSDHGFEYCHGKKRPYSHGGDSPQEMIVPCAVFVPGK